MDNTNVQLQYNENLPPNHTHEVHNSQKINLKELLGHQMHSDILTIKYDNNGQYLALGAKNGTKILYNLSTKKFSSKCDDIKENSITTLRWRPPIANQNNILVSADAGGYINYHHIPTLKPILTIHEQNNSIHSIDFSPSAKTFATGGKDMYVRVYDQQIKTIVKEFMPAGWNNVGHDNRIFAVKYIDDNVIMTGGWDTVVHFWDLRQGKSVKHFYGAHISGQSLDYHNGMILAGCYSATKQLQIWQASSLKKLQEIDWTEGNIDDAEYIYTASFNKRNPKIFGSGSTGPNSEVRLYQQQSHHNYKQILRISKLNKGCFSLDFSNKLNQFAFSTPHHGFYIYQYSNKS